VLACQTTEPIGLVPADRYRAELASGQYRLEWTWIAEDRGQIMGRAIWWGFAAATQPMALDCLYIHDSVADPAWLAGALLTAAQRGLRAEGAPHPPRYEIRLPRNWRADPAAARAFGWRREAAAMAGLTDELERLRFEWTPDAGAPPPSARLMFRREPDDEVFLDVFRRVAVGSLDVTTRREVAAWGADLQARDDMAIYLNMPGSRDWWQLAYTAGGALAGMILPNRNSYSAVVGYLGVVPEMRGRGYIDDLVAETTRFHASRGEQRISATTDTTNRPMAAAFERARYRVHGVRMVLSAPA
jgi:RimJ/RimL family protein N-acetyltransferase